MLKSKIIMDSGKEYIVDDIPARLIDEYTNKMGIVENTLEWLNENIIINPSHISSIEQLEE